MKTKSEYIAKFQKTILTNFDGTREKAKQLMNAMVAFNWDVRSELDTTHDKETIRAIHTFQKQVYDEFNELLFEKHRAFLTEAILFMELSDFPIPGGSSFDSMR